MKRRREDMEIVWQTPANPPERHDYIFRNGVRYVRPYYFEFISHAKNRWAGKTIVDLFTEEFKGRPRDYYMGICVKRPAHCYLFPRFYYLPGTNSTLHYDGRCMVSAVKSGRIQVDGDIVPVSYIVRPSQKISHFLHRHEPPVMAWDVSILEKESDVLTVCKPASIPVHPCGQYRLLILDRSASKADLFRQQIESGMVEKKYIAKVTGVFPEDEQIVNANVNYNAREGRSTVEVVDDCGNGNTLLKGKAACTKFNRISTNGTHSIVSCQPITGKTHQIRVHLQYTGHPIANDMLYLSESVADVSTDGIIADRAVFWSDHFLESDPNEDSGGAFVDNSNEVFTIDPMCTNCPNLAPNGCDGYEGGLWLRCVRYGGPGWVYECPLPDWANLG